MKRVSFQLEFLFRASPTILYKFLTTPACLVRWFCDGVDVNEDEYVFEWSGYEEVALVIDDIEEERLRFQWEEAPGNEYLEFKLDISPVTNETILSITDFCDEDEVDDQKKLWSNQVDNLRRETGG
ncbi:MAG: activator of HSP90 ATPase 1 family protein [Saprospiraceae bacterium]|nr:activator of HSP90 ATPase 1 family protein [Saprospiraceae bacterium]